jgi:hypothetical protein
MRTDYSTLIEQSEEELLALEKRHRNSHLSQRLKMLEASEGGALLEHWAGCGGAGI